VSTSVLRWGEQQTNPRKCAADSTDASRKIPFSAAGDRTFHILRFLREIFRKAVLPL
jgi:hypothetical protein